jgi:DNA-binding Xre family transcriptional regulator
MPTPGKIGHASVSIDDPKLTLKLKCVVEVLEARRVKIGMAERDLCQRAGINRTTYRRAMFKEGEHKGMTLRTFLSMCDALYLTPSDALVEAGL